MLGIHDKILRLPDPDWITDLLNCDEPIKTREEYVRSPIPYPGCKFESLKYLIPRLPKANTFIDGCGGSGVVTMNLPSGYNLKVFNDRHNGVTSFFRCIQNHEKCEKLIERLDNTVHSREDFVWCRDTWDTVVSDDVERAARWYYSVHFSFGAIGRNFARSTTSRAQHDAALRNKLPLLRSIKVRFEGVQVENLDVVQCLKDYANRNSAAYLDPDYIDTDPGIYRHKVDHARLLDFVFSNPGWFAVSNYANSLYDSYKWDERIVWEVDSTIRSKAYTESNNLIGKENVMGKWEKRQEVLYIKDFSNG